MFQFTTQTIINSLTQGVDYLLNTEGKHPYVRIGNIRFSANDTGKGTIKFWRKNHTPENLPAVTFDLSKILGDNQAGNYRIALYIGLANADQDSRYANDFVYKGRPFYFEFKVNKGDTATVIAKRIMANAKKYMTFMVGENLATLKESATGKLTITGVNGFQQFRKAVLQKYDPEAVQIDCCTTDGDFEDILIGIPRIYKLTTTGTVVPISGTGFYISEDGTKTAFADPYVPIEPGLAAFGDYNYIMHNLRIPTEANTNFWAVTKNELPSVGATYDQFTIEMCKDRDGIAGEVVGQRATSVTTHVFYVNSNLSDDFEALFTDEDGLNLTISESEYDDSKTVEVVNQTPYGTDDFSI